jgi:cyanate permease
MTQAVKATMPAQALFYRGQPLRPASAGSDFRAARTKAVADAAQRAPEATKQDRAGDQSISLPTAIGLVFVVAANLRPSLVSVGPVLGQLRHDFQLSNAQASLLISVPTLLMGLLAVPTPWLARRFGRNPVILAALTLLGIATLLRSFSASGPLLLLATAGAGAGIAIAGALISGFVKAHHPNRAC